MQNKPNMIGPPILSLEPAPASKSFCLRLIFRSQPLGLQNSWWILFLNLILFEKFLSVEPGSSSNFTFNMITLRIGPFWNFDKKTFSKIFSIFSKNFLSVGPGWPHNGKKIEKFFIADFCELKHVDSKNAKKKFRISENFSDNAEKPRITSNISTSWKGLELRSFASARYRSPLHSEAKWTKSLL